jgi:hypothetical protein
MSMKEAVRETALKLDRNMPGWEKCIDEDRLNIASSKHCMFGQLYGNFSKGLKRLGIPAGYEAGVALTMGSKTPHEDWARLKELWLQEIDLRIFAEELERVSSIKARDVVVAV